MSRHPIVELQRLSRGQHDSNAALDPRVEACEDDGWFEGIYGRSREMRRVFDAIDRVAATDAPVLVVGESGAGKELVARAIAARSRRVGPFVPVHAGAIPRELIASELFGHERGAFTGATTAAEGKFAAAEGGTLLLDEIATMTFDMQVVLLRVLETMRYTRVGGRREREADVRVLAASNRDLRSLVHDGRFREDLDFRVAIFTIALPPLRERVEDIAPLAMHFLRSLAARHGTIARSFSADAIDALESHAWVGNVRELRNVVERAVVFAPSPVIDRDDLRLEGKSILPSSTTKSSPRLLAVKGAIASPDDSATITIPLGTSMRDIEREAILRTIAHHRGNKQQAARTLGISRRSIYNRLREYDDLDGLDGLLEEDEPSTDD